MTVSEYLGCPVEKYRASYQIGGSAGGHFFDDCEGLDYDRGHAVAAAEEGNAASKDLRFDVAEMEEVVWFLDGKNDEASWIALFRAKDGRWWLMESSCDYTGWDCQAGGHATVCSSKDTAFGDLFVAADARERDEKGWAAAVEANT